MKLESEPVISHSTITKKTDSKCRILIPDTKAVESKKSVLDCPALNEKEGILKENQKGVGFDFEDSEASEDAALKVRNDIDGWVKFGDSMRMEDLTKDNEKGVRQFMKSDSLSSTDESEHRDSVSYVDKSVTECDLPELLVCYKESTDHVVKDICVDEGVPIQDWFLFDNGLGETNVWDFMPPEKDRESKALKGKQDMEADKHQTSALSGEEESAEDDSNQCDSRDLIRTSEWKNRDIKNGAAEIDDVTEKVSEDKDEASKEFPTLARLLLQRDSSMEHSNTSFFDREESGICQHSLQSESTEVILASAEEEPDNDKKEAEVVSCQDPADNGSFLSEVACDEDVQSKNITIDHVPSGFAHNSGEEHGETTAPEPLEKAHTYRTEEDGVLPVFGGTQIDHSGSSSSTADLLSGPVTEDNGQPSPNDLPDSSGEVGSSARIPSSGLLIGNSSRIDDSDGHHILNDLQNSQGESSFSMPGPVSGLVSYSGPIAYSGSLSLRSDSSTTSTRSFAFPVLQSEWNSSPVRMAKADRSQLRKHRWRETLLCCRF